MDRDRDRDRGAVVSGGGGDVLILRYSQQGSRRRVRRTTEPAQALFLPNNEIHLTVFQSSFLRKWILSRRLI